MTNKYGMHINKALSANGFGIGTEGNETTVVDDSGNLYHKGVQIDLDPAEVNAKRLATISMSPSDFSDDSEVETGFTLPEGAIVTNVFLNVGTEETTQSTKTVDVGTLSTDGGDADGFLAAVSVEATGLVKGTLANDGQTLGALLYVDEDGDGTLVPEPDIASGEKMVTVTAGDASGLSEATFDIIIEYIEVT